MGDLISVGTVARAARNIGDPLLTLPYIYAGEEVTVMGHPKVYGEEPSWEPNGYIVRNREGLQVVATREDITLEPVPPAKTLEEHITAAFREGYSQGHSRGLTCGKLYGGDDQYIVIIQVATRDYVRGLGGENESDC